MKRKKRWDWLISMIRERDYTIGAEIGCSKGQTTWRVLKRYKKLQTLYAVDLWAPVPSEVGGGEWYKNWNFQRVKEIFDTNIRPYSNRVIVLQGLSWEMAKQVEDNSLDFIFIDADHEYPSVMKDILAWTPKLKPYGMISGHDSDVEGVKKAIDELINDWVETGIEHTWYANKENVRL